MGLGFSLGQGPTLKQALSLPIDTAGEIELLSLHRIKDRLNTLDVSKGMQKMFVNYLIKENHDYRTEMKNHRYCITPDGLDNVVDKIKDDVSAGIKNAYSTVEDKMLKNAYVSVLEKELEKNIDTIKAWVYNNYDNIIYDTKGKIPYPVIMHMREKFRQWAFEKINPFGMDAGMLLEEVAEEQGIDPGDFDNYDGLWRHLRKYGKE